MTPIARIARIALSCTTLALAVAACTAFNLSNPQSITWFSLKDLRLNNETNRVQVQPQRIARNLLVSESGSNPFYNNTQLAYSRSDIARAYYQFSAWTERPGKRLAQLVEQRLIAQQAFTSVSKSTAGVRGDLELSLSLDAIFHDVVAQPQAGRIEVRARLVDRKSRRLIAQKGFTNESTIVIPDASNAVRAMSEASSSLLDELCAWVIENAYKNKAAPSN